MSRSPQAALWIAVVAAALAGSACGVYGPPVRAHEAAARREQSSRPRPSPSAPAVEPDEPAEPAVPAQEP
jgi:hypothetical protein